MITEKQAETIKKILVISLSNIGDVILTTPVISALHARFPLSELVVVAGPKGVPLLAGSRTIDRVIPFDKKGSWFKTLGFTLRLWREGFDLVVDLRNTGFPLFIQPRYRTPLRVDRSARSMRQRHLDRLRSVMPVPSAAGNAFHFFSEEERLVALEKLRNLHGIDFGEWIMIAPSAGSSVKRWTAAGFAETARHFCGRGRSVILAGDKSEMEIGLAVEQMIARPVANLFGALTLRELAALISRSALVISNDSAVMHLSHELGRPTVSVFGPTDETKYSQTGPLRRTVRTHLDCTPCELAQCRLKRRICLDDLPASHVIEAAEELLSAVPH